MIKKSKRQSKYFAPQNENHEHICDHPGCHKAGEYRAPKDRTLKEYYWFCLEHVQEYNSKWNYYGDDFASAEKEEFAGKFRFSSRVKYNFGFDFNRGYNVFEDFTFNSNHNTHIRLTPSEHEALKIMEIEIEDLDVDLLKKSYKKAVKKYHPDINSDNKDAEEKFKIISTSYKTILKKLE